MEIRARFVLIGVFVLAVVAAGFGFVYWIENTSGLGKQTSYRIRFDQSVSGLLLGSAVQFNGIRVGEVTDLKLDKDDPRRVLVTIAVAADTPVRADTTVGLVFGGLTGVPEIALTGGSPSSPPPAASDGGLPLLVASDSAGANWTDAARDAFSTFDTVLSDNSDAIKDAIANLDTFSKALAKNSDNLDAVVAGLVRLTGGSTKVPGAVVQLAAPKDFPQLAKEPAGQLIVGRPSAPVALETQRILLEAADGSVAPSFDEAQWGDSLPLLVQAKLIESFENAGCSRVASDLSGVSAEHQLLIELRAFRVVAGDTPMADVDFTAKLADSAGTIVSSKRFQASAPVAAMNANAAAAALSDAFDKAATDLVDWTLPLI
jgi:phospholipid/cholesterol/gamma-HCH transport system substrate-binding protein